MLGEVFNPREIWMFFSHGGPSFPGFKKSVPPGDLLGIYNPRLKGAHPKSFLICGGALLGVVKHRGGWY